VTYTCDQRALDTEFSAWLTGRDHAAAHPESPEARAWIAANREYWIVWRGRTPGQPRQGELELDGAADER